jgi:cytochrome c
MSSQRTIAVGGVSRLAVAVAAVAVGAALAFAGAAPTAKRGTPAEAKAMLQKAVEHYGSAGRAAALEDFTAGKAPFRDRDLYVVCVSADHKIAANGGYPTYVGRSADEFVDAKGAPLGKAQWDAANRSASGSIEYPLVNPMTGKLEDKTLFYQKVADDLLCGVGAFSAG